MRAAVPPRGRVSNPNAPIAHRRSAAEMAAAPMALIRSNTVAIGRDGGPFPVLSDRLNQRRQHRGHLVRTTSVGGQGEKGTCHDSR